MHLIVNIYISDCLNPLRWQLYQPLHTKSSCQDALLRWLGLPEVADEPSACLYPSRSHRDRPGHRFCLNILAPTHERTPLSKVWLHDCRGSQVWILPPALVFLFEGICIIKPTLKTDKELLTKKFKFLELQTLHELAWMITLPALSTLLWKNKINQSIKPIVTQTCWGVDRILPPARPFQEYSRYTLIV